MISYLEWQVARYLKTSPCTTERDGNESVSFILRMKAVCCLESSTLVTDDAPREQNSYEILPEPANRSSTTAPSKSILLFSTLNSDSLAKSVVGRAVMFLGGSIRLPRCDPEILLIILCFNSKRDKKEIPNGRTEGIF